MEMAAKISAKAHWPNHIDRLTEELPSDGMKQCHWVLISHLPQLEDETPPSSFYEVLENSEIAAHCNRRDKLVESLQRTVGTQTLRQAMHQAQTQTLWTPLKILTNAEMQTQPRTEYQDQDEDPPETQTQHKMEVHVQALAPFLESQPSSRQQLLLALQDAVTLRTRGRSLWSVLKSLLLLLSLMHSSYVLCRNLNEANLLRRLILSMHSMPPPPPPPPSPRALPAFVWGQICRVAKKLHIF